MLNLQESAGNYVDDVTDPTLLYSAGGVAVASILGIGMTIVPFYKLPAGNVIRTGTLLGLGAYVFNRSRMEPGARGEAYQMAGGLLFTAGAIQVLGYASNAFESVTGMRVPLLGTVGKLLSPASAFGSESIDPAILPQQGIGSVIGQQTATHSYSDIRNAESINMQGNMALGGLVYDMDESGSNSTSDWSFESMNTDMVNRVPANDPIDSIMEQPALGHGVTQNFGSEVADSTNAVRPHVEPGAHGYKANLMGIRSADPFHTPNPFVESVHPTTPSYQPPVWYAENEVTIESTPASPTPEVGGMHDTLNTYIMPSHTMSTAGNSGHGINAWFGAESISTGYLSRHVSASEGTGHVIGQ